MRFFNDISSIVYLHRMEGDDGFSLMFPCLASVPKHPHPRQCNVSVDISLTQFSTVFSFSNPPSMEVIDMSTYNEIVTRNDTCIIENMSGETITLYFLRGEAQLKRLLFTLADAGLLVSSGYRKFTLLSHPNFIPSGEYSTSDRAYDGITKLVWARVQDCETIDVPELGEFLDATLGLVHGKYNELIQKFFTKHQEALPDIRVSRESIIEWLLSQVNVRQGTFAKLQKRVKSGDIPESLSKWMRDIDVDAPRLSSRSSFWSDELHDVCVDVCKAAVLSNRYYFQGNMDVALGVALLVAGEDFGLRSSEGSPRKLKKPIQNELIFGGYMVISQMFERQSDTPDPRVLKRLIDKIGDEARDVITVAMPRMVPYLRRFGLDEFTHVANDFGPLFSRKFRDFWKLWIWVFQSEDPIKTFAAFEAAVTFFVLPDLEQFHILDPIGALGRWDDMASRVKMNKALILANYLLLKQQK